MYLTGLSSVCRLIGGLLFESVEEGDQALEFVVVAERECDAAFTRLVACEPNRSAEGA